MMHDAPDRPHMPAALHDDGRPAPPSAARHATADPAAPGSAPDHALLCLLQVCSASFPTGAFNHSYGFETWVDGDIVRDADSFESACRDWLLHGLVTADGAAVALAHGRQQAGDGAGLVELDRIVAALKLSGETRAASVKTGRALLTIARDVFRPAISAPYLKAVQHDPDVGQQAVAFGALAAAEGIPQDAAVMAFLHSSVANLAGVVARLVPLGQTDTQIIIQRMNGHIQQVADTALAATVDSLSASFVALDVASMQHETLYTRLCMS